jgi:hypothetical protein
MTPSTPPSSNIQPLDTSSAQKTRAEAFPHMTNAEIQVELEERYGPGFAQWFMDQLDRKRA